MKKLLILIVLLCFAVTAHSAIVIGGKLGIDVKDIKNPGASITFGFQEEITTNKYLRGVFQKANFGDSTKITNVGAMTIFYWGLGQKWDFGHWLGASYETDDAKIGTAFGIEMVRKGFFDNKLSIGLNAGVVNHQETGTFFEVGLNLIAFE